MAKARSAQAGRRDKKGDIFVKLEKRSSGGIELELTSSVEAMFGNCIRSSITDALKKLGVENARIEVEDRGALDYVIEARVEAAARRLYDIEGPGLLPAKELKAKKPVKDRLRRTRLYLPGNNPDLMLNAGLFGADCVILDLEDSVAPAEKDAARILVQNTLRVVDFGSSERIVRINPLETEYGEYDLEMVIPAGADTILIPKCNEAADVKKVERIAARVEKEAGIKHKTLLMPLIETARGIVNAYEIATASDRVVALCFGAEDFTADLGVERSREGSESFVARSLLVLAAKAAGVQAIDTVFSDVSDTEGLVASTKEAVSMGFEGKGVIHPSQIEHIHRAFAPSAEAIEYAKKVVAAIEKARAAGSGVASIGSKMIDAPIEKRARRILRLAAELGLDADKK